MILQLVNDKLLTSLMSGERVVMEQADMGIDVHSLDASYMIVVAPTIIDGGGVAIPDEALITPG